jgi:ABC-type transport system involved in multi-copper enzyme maturation permease subunit
MLKIYALIRETFLEALSKKILVGFLVIATLALAALGAYCLSDGFREAIRQLQPSVDDPSGIALREKVRSIYSGIGNFYYAAAILLAIFITSEIVPSMMEKGVIDLLLSKPLGRVTLLFGKVLGGLVVVVALLGYFTLGAWLIVSIATGIWAGSFLWSLLPILLSFMSLYALMVFVGLLTRSGTLGMILSYLFFAILSALLYSREELLFQFVTNEMWRSVVTFCYYITPQLRDMTEIAANIIQEKSITNYIPFVNVAGFSAVLLGASAVVFTRKEF